MLVRERGYFDTRDGGRVRSLNISFRQDIRLSASKSGEKGEVCVLVLPKYKKVDKRVNILDK